MAPAPASAPKRSGDQAEGGEMAEWQPPAANVSPLPPREAVAAALEQLIDWADAHRAKLRLSGLAAATGALAFLLRTGVLPGWRQHSSAGGLPHRLLGLESRRLPIALSSVAREGEVVSLQAAHYPLLRRFIDSQRGRPPAAHAAASAERGQLLNCYLAGVVQPSEDGMRYLQALPRQRVHTLHLLSVVSRADQHWTTAPDPAAAGAGPSSSSNTSSSKGAADGTPQEERAPLPWWRRWLGRHAGNAGTATASANGSGGASLVPLQPGGQASPHFIASGAVAGSSSAAGGAATEGWPLPLLQPQVGAQPKGDAPPGEMLWGELRAWEADGLLGRLLVWRRVDVSEQLLLKGAAAMMEPIDQEWLGVSFEQLDRLYAAQATAAAKGLGIWRVRRPSMQEWSRSLARSAWMRVRRTAGAVGGAIGSGVSAASGAVAGAAGAARTAVGAAAEAAKDAAASAAGRAAWLGASLTAESAASGPAAHQGAAAPVGPAAPSAPAGEERGQQSRSHLRGWMRRLWRRSRV